MQAHFARSARICLRRGVRWQGIHTTAVSGRGRAGLYMFIAGGGLVGAAFVLPPVYQDILEECDVPGASTSFGAKGSKVSTGKDELDTITWGANQYHTVSTDASYNPKSPSPFRSMSGAGVALRDLAFHEKHAACVDASGDIYQWGDGFFDLPSDSQSSPGPALTLSGKDIIAITLSQYKVYALSRSGKVYVLSSKQKAQAVTDETPGMRSSWWSVSWLWNAKPNIDHVELLPEPKRQQSEKFVSISAGRSHILALTSHGRTFAAPVTSFANSHGQLGMRKVQLTSSSQTSLSTRMPVELLPNALVDPFARFAPAVRTISPAPTVSPPTTTTAPRDETLDETDIRYCDMLFEVPSLKGVDVAQVVAGSRSSYVRTRKEGRVLGFGANEFGQMALGGAYTTDFVPAPTEIILTRGYPGGTNVKCIDVAAGGDIVYFTVETSKGAVPTSSDINIDLLAAGMGQFGSLGNAGYIQAQGTPVKVKVISGVKEYNEVTRSNQPLACKLVSASPTGHTIVLLDTFQLDGNVHAQNGDQTRKGRDVLVWGANSNYQLGLGKRSSMAVPTPLPSVSFIGGYDVDDQLNRMMARERTVSALTDLKGKKVAKNAKVEQSVVAGWGCSAMYWKVVQ